MKNKRPLASLSLDLDDKWTYMKTHGDTGWKSFPSYLDVVVPRIVDFLKERNLTITFFIVGQDAAFEKNHEVLRSISDAGHEIANHSFRHDPWLHLYSEEEIETEIATAEEKIENATGRTPIGFRAPGFSFSHSTLRALVKRGYLYDASTLPNFLNPLSRAYFFLTGKFTREEVRQRKMLFGKFTDGFRPLATYNWSMDEGSLVEIPVTTLPIFRVPIHLSYILYLSKFSQNIALQYFHFALKLCKMRHIHPSILLHPLDFLGIEDGQGLPFFPAMTLPREQKLLLVNETLRLLASQFAVQTLNEHAQFAEQGILETHTIK